MSFPGHSKSIKLMKRHKSEPSAASGITETDVLQAIHGKHDTWEKDEEGASDNANRPTSSSASEGELIVDERGNSPSKSLWVGNIPQRTTSSEIRSLFNKFGNIVSTKPTAKYAFVNFETVESAIAAFKRYHDKDIFNTGNATINIRFTATLAQAKQAKDDCRERQTSMASRAEAAQKQYFQTSEVVKKPINGDGSEGEKWPNGKPPTGPKSQQRKISPPPLRRGDTYRPAETSRTGSHRSDEHTRIDKDEYRRGRAYRRAIEQHHSPRSSISRSQSRSRIGTSISSSRRSQSRERQSPVAWWDRANSGAHFRNLLWTKPDRVVEVDNTRTYPLSDGAKDEAIASRYRTVVTNATSHDQSTRSSTTFSVHTPDYEPQSPKVGIDCALHETHNLCDKAMGDYRYLAPIAQLKQPSKSPSLRPIQRLRIENESTDGASVRSDTATSSSKASSRKKKCSDCKKAASDLSPLFSCSSCTRRYHAGCGNPKPATCPEESKFVCERCLRKRETEAVASVPLLAETDYLLKLNRKPHLVSPPLSLSHDGSGSTNMSPHDQHSCIPLDEHRLESFFTRHEDDLDTTAKTALNSDLQSSLNAAKGSTAAVNDPPMPQVTTQCSSIPKAVQQHIGIASPKKGRYKVVTCKWWILGSCTQTEVNCYFAHEHTGILLPDRKRLNKAWTCYDWLHNKCEMSERNCLYAHQDTGLHVWKDGRPSYKHVTCYWWTKGWCKWNDEFCKFAHEDTGLYSLDPSEVWQGGSKFTTINPGEGSTRPLSTRWSTTLSSTSNKLKSANEASNQDTSSPSQCINTQREKPLASTGTKPLLTINTSSGPSSSSVRPYSITNFKPFRTTIGAPPQTPNEDSPDKARSLEFNTSTAIARFSQSIVALPTPGFEECIGQDNEDRDYIGAQNHALLHSTTAGSELATLTAVEDKKLPTATGNAVTKGHSVSSSFGDNWSWNTKTPDVLMNSESLTSRDPRRQRQRQGRDSMSQIHQEMNVPPITEFEIAIGNQDTTKTSFDLQNSDESRRSSVRRCQQCQKPVFGTDICRGCSGRKGGSEADRSLDASDSTNTGGLVHEQMTQGVSKTSGPSTIKALSPTNRHATQGPIKTTLKRGASGSDCFFQNKRLKSSALLSSNTSTGPDASRRESIAKRPQWVAAKLGQRRKPKQTLDDLINEERAKNKQKQNDPILDDCLVESPVSDSEKENNMIEIVEEHSRDFSRVPDLAGVDNLTMAETSPVEVSHVSDTDLFSSSQSPRSTSISNGMEALADKKEEARVSHGISAKVKASQRPFYKDSHWRDSESPEPESRQTTSDQTVRHGALLQSTTQSSTTQEHLDQTAKPKGVVASNLHSAVSYDGTNQHAKFRWASSITCTQCQKNHKKCLHAHDGSLCPQKCREYVLSRKGKPDTGRSRQEWTVILQISELDPDSDTDSEEDTGSENVSRIFSSESEGDYVTAMDDEMMVDHETHESEDGEALVEKFKRPLPPQQYSPEVRSPTIVKQLVTKGRGEIPTTPVKRDKMTKSHVLGVMFESESEDEDYLSDEHQVPVRMERPIDPLYMPPRTSRDLFEIAPELAYHHLVQQYVGSRNHRQPRPSRKEQWAELRSRQFQERREKFGNPHWEVDRRHPDITVCALVERIVPPRDGEDRLAVGSVQVKEESMSFNDFLGGPKLPEICLMNDEQRVAFRDGQKDRDRTFGRTGRGLGRRTTDEEKWPVRTN